MQMASPDTPILAAGGMEDGGIGTDAFRIQTAIEEADRGEGVLLLVDLGSAIMSAETAIDFLDEEIDVRIADTPVLEGAVSAAVTASSGGDLDEVLAAAMEARSMQKLS
jgi:dihydroxyacetone kinase phosphotransfer subunit